MDKSELFEFRDIVCPVCGRDEPKLLGYRGGNAHQNGQGIRSPIVRCRICTHQYPNPMPLPKAGIEELYVNADEYFQNHDLEVKKQNGLSLMKSFETRVGRKGRFLDVGCGRGELIWAAKQSLWGFEGIDPSPEFVEFGRKNLGVDIQVQTLEGARFESESFDAVAMGGLIEHLYDPAELLEEVHRVLKPDGWLWFDAPNEDGLYMQLGNAYMKMLRRDWVVVLAPTFSPFHVQGFNPKSLRLLLDRSNFVVKELEVYGGVTEQTGHKSFRKKIEFQIASGISWLGNSIGRGTYMNVWTQKR